MPNVREAITMSERYRVVYVTADSTQWAAIDVPDGLIAPPTIELHMPSVGPVSFFYASCHRLPIPEEAGTEGRYDTDDSSQRLRWPGDLAH